MRDKHLKKRPGSWRLGRAIIIFSIVSVIIKTIVLGLLGIPNVGILSDLIIYALTAVFGAFIMFASFEKLKDRPPEMKLGLWKHRPRTWKIGIVTLVFIETLLVLDINDGGGIDYTIYFVPSIIGIILMMSCWNKVKDK